MRIDVFPEPVGPTMRLICPRSKIRSPSMWSVKLRLDDPGVDGGAFVQVNDALQKPRISLDIDGEDIPSSDA